MTRVWLLVIPALSPLLVFLVLYVVQVFPQVFDHIHPDSSDSIFGRWWRYSKLWWGGTMSRTEYALLVSVIGFLAGGIIALLLHLFLPRRSASGQPSDHQ